MSQPSKPSGESPEIAARLVDQLEGQGELVEESSFSIDASRALAKLREFQLVDAHAYVLLLIEAAVLGGVDEVRVELSSGGLSLELGALGLDRDRLEQLFAAVFIDLDATGIEHRRRRATQKLALACNAALSLEPRAIEIETTCAGQGLRLRLSPDEPTGTVEAIEETPPTTIRVHSSGLGTMSELGESPEHKLIREHCEFSSLPIYINDTRVSQDLGYALHTEMSPNEMSFSVRARKLQGLEVEGVEVGYAALRYGGGLPAELRLLSNGVLAERIMLGDDERPAAPDFMVIVDLDLAKDLGQRKLIRGPKFDAVLAATWAVHDRIAPKRFGKAKGPARIEWNIPSQEIGIYVGVISIGSLLLWASIDDGGYQGTVLSLFAAVLVAVGLFGLVRFLLSLRTRANK